MKRWFVLTAIIVAIICICSCSYAASRSGECGPDATFSLDDYGVLTISGTGEVANHPWWDNAQRFSPTAIVVKEGITSICSSAFCHNDDLREVSLPESLTSISAECFLNCSKLTNISLPKSLRTIGAYAFQHCIGLTEITIPDSVTSIGNNAFEHCVSLKAVSIPGSVTAIGDLAFAECSSLTDVEIADGIQELHMVFYACDQLRNVTLPNSIVSLYGTFTSCGNLSGITLPDSLDTIGAGSFRDCSALEVIRIPERVTTIEADAFSGCSSLTSVSIPVSVVSIGGESDAFSQCDSLASIEIPACNSAAIQFMRDWGHEAALKIGNHISIIADAAVEPSCTVPGLREGEHCGYCGAVIIPQEEEPARGHTEEIDQPAYSPTCTEAGQTQGSHCMVCNEVLSVPETIPALGHDWNEPNYTWAEDLSTVTATAVCRRDETHVMTETVHTTIEAEPATYTATGRVIYSAVFENPFFATQTQETVIPALTAEVSVSGYKYRLYPEEKTASFTGVEKEQTKITIPDTITDNGETFAVTAIAAGACKESSKLKKITIGANVTTIGKNAFMGCAALEAVNGGTGLVSIGESAFMECTALTGITLGKYVESIGKKAFFNCSGLETIIILTTKLNEENVQIHAFRHIFTRVAIRCPAQKLNDYIRLMRKKGVSKAATYQKLKAGDDPDGE